MRSPRSCRRLWPLLAAALGLSAGPAGALGPWSESGPYPAETLPDDLQRLSRAVSRSAGAEAALAAVDETHLDTPAGRLLRAEALRLSGDCTAAVPVYEAVLLTAPRLVDTVRLHLARCLAEIGRHGDAAAVLEGFPEDSRHLTDALHLRAESLLAAGDPAAARAALATETAYGGGGAEAARAHLLRGRAALRTGDAETAIADFVRAILVAPAAPAAREAAEQVALLLEDDEAAEGWRLLAGAVGRRDAGPRLARVARDRRASALRPLLATARGRFEADAGRHVAALALFAEGATSEDPDVSARARHGAAASALALGRRSVARAHWEALAGDHPLHPLAASARLEAATLAARARDHAGVRESLEDLLLHQPVGAERPQALFLLGWSLLHEGEPARAAGFFASAATEAPAVAAYEDVYGGTAIASAARARYWAGRAHRLAGDDEAAESDFRHVLAHHPLSYYAELATGQLSEMGTGPGKRTAPAERDGAAETVDPRVRRARQALDLGWRREALRSLAPVMARPAEFDGHSLFGAAALLEEMGRIGAARGMYRAAVLHGSADLSAEERLHASRFAFPRRYGELIEREANRWGYSPWLLYALVLRESGFAPCAKSHAGATGLAQLMMSAAGDAAADLGLPAPTAERLCEPEYNLRLGAWHLRKLLRRYGGSEILALAAYNAGPGSVDRWLERAGDLPVDAFVEEIPFEETRAYVRLVISAARGYALTWDEAAGAELGLEGRGEADAGTFASGGR